MGSIRAPLASQSISALRVRAAKVRVLQAARLLRWVTEPRQFSVAAMATASSAGLTLQHRILVCVQGVQSHPILEEGKQQNLAIAAAHFDGRVLSADAPFSFWRLLGRPAQARGFALGTELRDGCVVPALGGGLCLLSGALFRLAAEMDWSILERHGHTLAGANEQQVDATVMWPQVDLRFAPKQGSSILRVRVRHGVLSVAAYGLQRSEPRRVWRETQPPPLASGPTSSRVWRSGPSGDAELLGVDHKRVAPAGLARNCLTCEARDCHARAGILPSLLRVLH